MKRRLTRLQIAYMLLVVGGGGVAVTAGKLGADRVVHAGILAAALGVSVFGLDLIVQRRADISTTTSSHTDPAFHVFRGPSAVAWGIGLIAIGLLAAAATYMTMTGAAAGPGLLSDRPGVVMIFAGLMLSALGIGQAGRATYRYRNSEKSVRRLGQRIYGLAVMLPVGIAVLLWGTLSTFAPALADDVTSTARGLLERWLGN